MRFTLVPEGSGYRLTPIGEMDADAQKNIRRIPLFMPVNERSVRLEHTVPDDNLRIVVTIEMNEAGDTATLRLQFDGANKPDDSIYEEVKTIRLVISGDLKPGSIPASQLEAEIRKRLEAITRQ